MRFWFFFKVQPILKAFITKCFWKILFTKSNILNIIWSARRWRRFVRRSVCHNYLKRQSNIDASYKSPCRIKRRYIPDLANYAAQVWQTNKDWMEYEGGALGGTNQKICHQGAGEYQSGLSARFNSWLWSDKLYSGLCLKYKL